MTRGNVVWGRREIIFLEAKSAHNADRALEIEKGTVADGSAETSINSYCQGQADLEKNIRWPDGRVVWPVLVGPETGYQQFHSRGTIG